MKTHRNIPVFVTFRGCPNRCVFCDQKSITGTDASDIAAAKLTLEKTFSEKSDKDTEIAFFGGSFTAIKREDMTEYLKLASGYVRDKKASGIRLSTRPDKVDDETLLILREYGVTSVELGIQSLSDRVLTACRRGHTAKTALEAMERVKKYGFELTGQMMTGLPASSFDDELMTAKLISSHGADCARIYPTAVFPGTELEEMMLRGDFTPQNALLASEVAAKCLGVFIENKVRVLRIGLCAQDFPAGHYPVAGAYHPAVGEMAYSRYYLDRIEKTAGGSEKKETLTVFVHPGEISKAVGQNGKNKEILKEKYGYKRIFVKEDPDIEKYDLRVE